MTGKWIPINDGVAWVGEIRKVVFTKVVVNILIITRRIALQRYIR
jgi:hypothetical protein